MPRRRGVPLLLAISAACSTFTDSEKETGSIEVLARGQGSPWCLALDATNIYFTNRTGPRSIVVCPKTGCGDAPRILATDQVAPDGIAVDDVNVYWTSNGEVRSIAKDGSAKTPTTLHAGKAPRALAFAARTLYWADVGSGSGTIEACDAPGCSKVRAVISYQPDTVALALDGSTLFWTAGGKGGYVASCPPCDASNHPPHYVTKDLVAPQGLAFDDERLYVAAGMDEHGAIVSMRKGASWDTGEPPQRLALERRRPFGIAVDTRTIYFTTRGTQGNADGEVVRMDKSGQNARPLATGQAEPASVVVDGDWVYWTNPGDGTVKRVRGS